MMSENGSPSKPRRGGKRDALRTAYAAVHDTVQFTRGRLALDPNRDLNRAQRFLAANLRVIFLTVRLDVYKRLELHAQALTFKTLLSLVPIFVVVFAILSAFGGGLEKANQEIVEYAIVFLSGSAQLREEIASYINANTFRDAELGGLTIVILVWTVMSLLSHVENSFNTLFGVTSRRSAGVRLLSYWALLTLGPLLILVSVALTAALQTSGFAEQVQSLGTVGVLVIRSTPLLVTWIAFTVLYLTVPNTRVRIVPAVLAALVAGSLWNLAKFIFAWYARSNVTVQDIYGSLAAFPMFIIWLYISWVLVLFGAQLCYAFQHAATYQPEAVGLSPSHAARERAACRLFFAIARDFCHGEPPTQVAEAAQRLGIPGHLQERVITDLRDGDFVVDTTNGGMVPARDLQGVTVADLLTYVGQQAGHTPVFTEEEAGRHFDELLDALGRQRQRIAGNATFVELVQLLDPAAPAAPAPAPAEPPEALGAPSLSGEPGLVALPGKKK